MANAVKTLIEHGWPPMMLTVRMLCFAHRATLLIAARARSGADVRRDVGNGAPAEAAALPHHREQSNRRLVDLPRGPCETGGSGVAAASRSGDG